MIGDISTQTTLARCPGVTLNFPSPANENYPFGISDDRLEGFFGMSRVMGCMFARPGTKEASRMLRVQNKLKAGTSTVQVFNAETLRARAQRLRDARADRRVLDGRERG